MSNLRLQVDQPADHAAAANDPGANNKPQGYAAHYCNIPTDVNPKVVACSFIASGLRVFDISDIGASQGDRLLRGSAAAALGERVHGQRLRHVQARVRARAARDLVDRRHQRLLRRARRQERVAAGRLGRKRGCVGGGPRACASRRSFTVHLRTGFRGRVRSARVLIGRRVVARLRRGRNSASINLRGLPVGPVTVRIVMHLTNGRIVTDTRHYRLCTTRRPHRLRGQGVRRKSPAKHAPARAHAS